MNKFLLLRCFSDVVILAADVVVLRTFEGVLINDQQTASLHLITKCDTVGSASVSC